MPKVTIPTKNNINRQSGTLVLRVSQPEPKEEHLLETGRFVLRTTETSIDLFTQSDNVLNVPVEMNGSMLILWTWIESNHRLIVQTEDGLEEETAEDFSTEAFGSILSLANDPAFTGSFQSIEIFAGDYLYGEVSEYGINRFMYNNDRLFHADYTRPMHYVKEPVVEQTMAPEDGSPILVEDSDGLLRRQYFFDRNTGEYTSQNTEEFHYKGEDELHLSYTGLDRDFTPTVAFEDGETLLVSFDNPESEVYIQDETVFINLTEEMKSHFYDQMVYITYQLDRSYTVEYNEDVAHDSYRVIFSNHSDREISVTQEGNRFSNQKLAKEIEFNPLVNSRHTGFLYIDKEPQVTTSFRLNISSNYVSANGADSADFIIEAIDEEGNEVLSPYLDVFLIDEQGRRTDELGRLRPVVNFDTLKARNTAGRCYYKYTSPVILSSEEPDTQRVFAVAYDRFHRIGAQFPLIIRPIDSEEERQESGQEVPAAAAIPFEYFARFYERELPDNHPLGQLDQDEDGTLTRQDFIQFEQRKLNRALMQELTTALREGETF